MYPDLMGFHKTFTTHSFHIAIPIDLATENIAFFEYSKNKYKIRSSSQSLKKISRL